jgi:predicted amidohydrolase
MTVLAVGAPLRFGPRIYNTAVVIHRGRLLGIVPKVYLPTYREFYEKRHFASGAGIDGETIRIGGLEAPFGTDLLFSATDLEGLILGLEICEDMWIPIQPAAGAGGPPQPALPGDLGPLPRGLYLRGSRGRRIDHRPRLGRADLDL